MGPNVLETTPQKMELLKVRVKDFQNSVSPKMNKDEQSSPRHMRS